MLLAVVFKNRINFQREVLKTHHFLTYLSVFLIFLSNFSSVMFSMQGLNNRVTNIVANVVRVLVYLSKVNIHLCLGVLVAECYAMCIIYNICSETTE